MPRCDYCELTPSQSTRRSESSIKKKSIYIHSIPRTKAELEIFVLNSLEKYSWSLKMASAYSQDQLTKYLQYLNLPAQYAKYIHNPESFPKTEEALTTLFRCQITRFPYDNLSVHYSATNLADIDPQNIYVKFLGPDGNAPTGRGGYCLECSIFFHHVLLGLEFSVYMTGVRNRERIDGIPQGEFKGW